MSSGSSLAGVGAAGDTWHVPSRLSSGHLVGRTRELAELELAWREAAQSDPALVLLGGDSGIGKSRLLGELQGRARQAGGRVLQGGSLDQEEAELPYAPLVGALRDLVRERDPALEALSAGSRRVLAGLLPGLDDGAEPPEFRGGTGQLRLFEALFELIDRLSEDAPLLLALEDVHWADRSTRTFVSFLARSLRCERVLVILTYRSDELHRRHPLRPLLSELERIDRSRSIELAPLSAEELTEALADILGADPDPLLVRRLYARSEGNPLFTEELLAAGLDGRGSAPQSLRDAFMLRIERLSADAQAAVRAIAVGRRLRENEVAEVTGLAGPAAQAALREAIAEQVLVSEDDGRIAFRHALLREVVGDDLLPGERTDLHAALARMLAAQVPDDPAARAELVATIAGHWAGAGDREAALRASVDAARSAIAVNAFGVAADMAESALELWPRVGEPEQVAGIGHVRLLRMAASAHSVGGGEQPRVEALLVQALDELGEDPDPVERAALLDRLARTQWSLNRGPEAIETAQSALAMLPDGEAEPERASLLSWLARMRMLRGRLREALIDARGALEAAVAAGDRAVESEVLNTLGSVQMGLGLEREGEAALRRAIEISRADDDLSTLAYAISNLADVMNIRGHTAEAVAVARDGLAATPRWLGGARDWMALTLSEMAFDIGDWRLAREQLGQTGANAGESLLLIFRLIRETELALGEGDLDHAGRLLEELEPIVACSSEPQWIGASGSLLGEYRRARRDLPAARAAVDHGLDRLEVCTEDVMRIARLSGVGVRVEADIALRARDFGERATEKDALARARIHVQRLNAAAQEGGPVEQAWKATGAAEMRRARGRPDPMAWAKAAAAWHGVGTTVRRGLRAVAPGRGGRRTGRSGGCRRAGRGRAHGRGGARCPAARGRGLAVDRAGPAGHGQRRRGRVGGHRRHRRGRGAVRPHAA